MSEMVIAAVGIVVAVAIVCYTVYRVMHEKYSQVKFDTDAQAQIYYEYKLRMAEMKAGKKEPHLCQTWWKATGVPKDDA